MCTDRALTRMSSDRVAMRPIVDSKTPVENITFPCGRKNDISREAKIMATRFLWVTWWRYPHVRETVLLRTPTLCDVKLDAAVGCAVVDATDRTRELLTLQSCRTFVHTCMSLCSRRTQHGSWILNTYNFKFKQKINFVIHRVSFEK